MRRRRFNKRYAKSHGYFWLPCPLCGQHSGGHEWRRVDGRESSIPHPSGLPGMARGICPDCTKAGRGDAAWASAPDALRVAGLAPEDLRRLIKASPAP